ncbi:E3 ubiquitin-protein ligase MIB2 [Octopus bimaculoides]|nr:E3 ubiquitin-protein ligase MIB2 [Octopus bimaculoides]|eukprot:XP_014776692.1 PREDICTED: E3 ubiquitin-protein ligase MIB2-like [Octopus bimaculoides]
MTPLLEAVSRGHLGMMHKLIVRGADINAVNYEDNNCLHLAVETVFHSDVEPLSILNEYCKGLKLKKEEKLSGVVVACYLAHQGANFYCENKKGLNPLDLLTNADLKEELKILFPPQCWQCQEKKATVTLHPCRHIVLCKNCCSKITLKRCPMCPPCIPSKSGFVTAELSEKFFQDIAQQLGDQWQQVGRNLGIKNVQLNIIMCNNPNNTVEQSFQMLYRWFTSCDPDTRTFRTLRDALQAAQCFDALEYLSSGEK